MNRKTVLILTIQFGAGHYRVASAVAQSCAKQFPEYEAKVVDVTPFMPRWMRWVYVDLYLFSLRHLPLLWRELERVQRRQVHTFPVGLLKLTAARIYRRIKDWNLAAIVSTEVGVNEIASQLKDGYFSGIPLVAIITDYDVDRAWIQGEVDRYCAGSEEVCAELLTLKAPVEKVRVTGIPIDDRFLQPASPELTPQKELKGSEGPRILVAGGGEGLLRVKSLLEALDEIVGEASVTVLVGANRKLKRSLERLRRLNHLHLSIQEWTAEMPHLLHSHDFMVSKPGGVTVTEAMAAGLPLLACFPLPGSEVKHCQLVEKWGIGLAALSLESFRVNAMKLVSDEALRRRYSEQSLRAYKEQHAHPVVEVLQECLIGVPSPHRRLQIEFDEWASAGRGEQMEQHHRSIAQATIDRMDLKSQHRVLDLGCGTGWASRRIAERVSRGNVLGIDVSIAMIERARAHPENPAHVRFLQGSADALPFAKDWFDMVFSCESFYYYPDLQKALREVRRVLLPGGKFFCLVNLFKENSYTHVWVDLLRVKVHLLGREDYEHLFREAEFEEVCTSLVPDSTPIDGATFEPGWGVDTLEDLKRYRAIGALLIVGKKVLH